ncbi:MAG: pseudouridine synthase, partial [Thermodesulfobacteriota bacterium]
LLILEKPGLIPTHPLNPFETGTVANALMALFPQIGGVGGKPFEPGLVHRLDRGTSGLLALAMNEKSWTQMKEDLTRRRWKKTYWALVEGVLNGAKTISLPLAHDPGNNQKMKVIRSEKDKRRGRVYQALTRVRPQKVFKNHTLVEIDLISGVTHQIRAHLSAVGHPLVGDILYGAHPPDHSPDYPTDFSPDHPPDDPPSDPTDLPLLPPGRFFLHAGRLSLPHPMTREPKTFSTPFPQDLRRVLSHLTV